MTPRYALLKSSQQISTALFLSEFQAFNTVSQFDSPNLKSLATSVRALFYREASTSVVLKKQSNSKFINRVLYLIQTNEALLYFTGLFSGLVLAIIIRVIF
jgi:hypothetical protein